ncbi:hypothetical protein [Synechococcus sp. PCC 6312]|uniref:hypothetical protein n=1 Tax=Synechococcus sp. (strain ATCC 27167 / PCC 6312) TaxID=195253 RepID=UPI00029ECEF5|nr:hypothetical protein [Synechococcus sp. PCC 6312]AFY62384.1 hypothetical protein Syn6312_3350 [Synechococcus sp. PCC 6312]
MEPFAVSLGIDKASFEEWKEIIFKNSDELLLVEGEIDKEYFHLLSEGMHAEKKLDLNGEVFVYGGVGFFDNLILLKFLLNRFTRIIITYDLDADDKVSNALSKLQLKRNEDYFSVGKNESGKKDIEGLLPDSVNSEVFSEFPDLAVQAMGSEKNLAKSAKQKLKAERLKKFKEKATIENGYFDEFYVLVSKINKAMKKKRK